MSKRLDLKRKQMEEDRHKLERAQITTALAEEKLREFGETNSVLDQLRRTRKSRGGVGAPLQVPTHLKDAAQGQGIVITDADLDPPKG